MTQQAETAPSEIPSQQLDFVRELLATLRADPDTGLQVVQKGRQRLAEDPALAGDSREDFQSLLRTLETYHQALRLQRVGREQETAQALQALQKVEEEFRGWTDPMPLRCVKLARISCQAQLEVQRVNFERAKQCFQDEEWQELRRGLEDHIALSIRAGEAEVDTFLLAAVQAVARAKLPEAQIAFATGASRLRDLADHPAVKGTAAHAVFLWKALFYETLSSYYHAFYQFNTFQYDDLADPAKLAAKASEAKEALESFAAQADVHDSETEAMIAVSSALELLLLVLGSLADLMNRILRSTFKPRAEDLRPVTDKIAAARASAQKAGPRWESLLITCDQLADQVKSLERLARPNLKDFGVVSGLIAAAAFTFLLLVVFASNTLFGLGLHSEHLVQFGYICLPVSLATGFGVAGFKYGLGALTGKVAP